MKIFIPIKHSSQRVPGKNLRDFNGIPLYKHTLYKFVDFFDIYIDTDSKDIIDEINNNVNLRNVTVYERKDFLRGHDVSVNLLIQDFLKRYSFSENQPIIQTHVTSPFLKIETLHSALEYMENHDSVISCNEIKTRLWRAEHRSENKRIYLPVNHNPMILEETQNLNPIYEENSLFYIFTKKSFEKDGNRIGKNPKFYPVGFPENMDIDTEEDFQICLNIEKGN